MLRRAVMRLGILICLAGTVATGQSDAQVIPWFGAGAGYGTYAMEDVNAEIRYLDTQISEEFDEMEHGAAFAAGAGIDINQQVRVGLHYQRLLASSEVSDFTGSLKYDFPANLIFGSVSYLPVTRSEFRPGLGVSGGLVSADGTLEISLVGAGAGSGAVTGNGYYAGAHLSVDIPMGQTGAFIPQLSYRYAKIPEVEIQGQTIYNPDGTNYTLDYSGIVLTVSLRFFITEIY